MLDSVFTADDKLINGLRKLGQELETDSPKDQQTVTKLREICARLIKYNVETIRARLDRVYLEALSASVKSTQTHNTATDELSALEEELESLYAEILPVSQMSVEQQYLRPALDSISDRSGRNLDRSNHAIRYVSLSEIAPKRTCSDQAKTESCLDYLISRAKLLESRIKTFKDHQHAFSEVANTARTELAVNVPTPTNEAKRPADVSPVRRRKSSGQLGSTSPMRTRTPGGRRRRSSGNVNLDLPPLEQLLQDLALLLPQEETKGEQLSTLGAALVDRAEKTRNITRNVQESFESSAASQLADSHRALGMLRTSILAESPFAEVKLADPEIDDSIDVLANEVANVERLVLEAENRSEVAKAGTVTQRAFISAWSR
jgi:hypothetical protein